MELKVLSEKIFEANKQIENYVFHTPLICSTIISHEIGAEVYLKLENEQSTGSFKLRGAFNKAIQLKSKGILEAYTASTGNHGLACALAFDTLGLKGKIVVPLTASSEKVDKLKETNVEIIQYGNDCEETETYARMLSQQNNSCYISPYNDYDVIAGQGTVGVEILQDLPEVDIVFVSVGGGGLISGIGTYIKNIQPKCKVIGCSPRNSKVMHESIKVGRIIQEASSPTLSDGTAGGIECNSVTFPLCEKVVDDWVLVTEDEISDAIFYCLKQHKKVIEGAAGVALAGVRKLSKEDIVGKKVAVVLCGSNISLNSLSQIIQNNISTSNSDK